MKKILLLALCSFGLNWVATAQHRLSTNGISVKRIVLDHKTPLDNKLAATDLYTSGIEFGYTRHLANWFNLAVPIRVGSYNTFNTAGNIEKTAFIAGADLLGQLKYFDPNKYATIYVQSGIGATAEKLNNLGLQVPIGLGFNVKLLDDVYLNAQTEYRYGLDGAKSNLQHGFGVLLLLGGEKKAKVPPILPIEDKDKDGVADADDSCPDVFGLVLMNGCPDADGDKITDAKDACPTEAGTLALKGCPDKDKDGVADKDDKCPTEAGPSSNNGCPQADADGDGVADIVDECPNAAGLATMNGCPDRDADGVADKNDLCPDEAGTIALNGCADTDADGIVNDKDKCPTEAGIAENNGCPKLIEVVKEVKKEDKELLTLATKMVQFEKSKAVLLATSMTTLDQIAAILKAHPEYKLMISGHTDNIGEVKRNQRLSEDRAKACRDALVLRGIDVKRLNFAGYGKSKPVADNRTKDGRDRNRRVEFELSLN
jgi:outer membrane protein OmpA-like peptidoglycan-associated protein